MDYEIVFGPGALDRIPEWVPEEVVRELERQLDYLRADPANRSQRIAALEQALSPILRRGQRYAFMFTYQGRTYHFAVYFYYRDNEYDLRVYDVEMTWEA
jgi:hypothetical protein